MKKPAPVRITDHAVLRYMERVMELNVDLVRQHIADLCAGPAAIGAICVRAEGFRFEITNGVEHSTVTTVRPDRVSPGATTKERNQRFIERQGPAT